ncbi:DUF2199 domain-containing protein [Pacificibacter marinus]|uniref:DUF2199 domain-containing protein n=1 Tax=Pacificibacter marinus TaxID=658057 RepID=A0A1Y5SMM9_9RHOB|nr:DUF2199 domain-containing protein [Pacificibacter marinus]SEK71485.1 hypothetical protein SAMN04488032_105200 [Pacificibacter marinus]SLN44231.1 hypothetical protein PAM7971_02126 [Pacificibacter marinus]
MTSILDLDPRWRALQDMGGVMDIGFDHPSAWPHGERGDQPFVKLGDDQLASELCRFGEDRFICATLALPIRGSDEHVVFALWVKVPNEGFYAYIETFDGAASPAPFDGKLSSDLGPLANLGAKVSLEFNDTSTRPTATLAQGATDISLDDLIDLYEATGTLSRDDLSKS